MTSSNCNIFRVTGHLCGELIGHRLFSYRRHFQFFHENCTLKHISLTFVPRGSVNNTLALAQIMPWRWTGDRHFSIPMMALVYWCMADNRFASSQWETSLQSNAVSHWLGANLESALWCMYASVGLHGLSSSLNMASTRTIIVTITDTLKSPVLHKWW